MKRIIVVSLFFLMFSAYSNVFMGHKMQHGFILTQNDTFASHLVASGHHSRQTSISGKLVISHPDQLKIYEERKKINQNT